MKTIRQTINIDRRGMLRKVGATCLACSSGLFLPSFINNASASNKQGLKAVRDAESEEMFKELTYPLLKQAGIATAGFRCIIIVDNNMQAWVNGGNRVFFSTGMLLALDSRDQIEGVLAHEIGHLMAGHIFKLQNQLENQSQLTLAGLMAAITLGLATSRPDVAGAVAIGATGSAYQNTLSFSRDLEGEADLYAINLMLLSGGEPQGFPNALKKLNQRTALPHSAINPYLLTHPITTDRIEATQSLVDKQFENLILRNDPKAEKITRKASVNLERLQGKLRGYLQPVSKPPDLSRLDRQDKGKMAQACIQAMRLYQFDNALEIAAELKKDANDPFIHEIEGDIQLRAKMYPQAYKSYKQALEILPQNPLFSLALLRTINNSRASVGDAPETTINEIITPALAKEPNYVALLQEAAKYSHIIGDAPRRELYLAQAALLLGRAQEAIARITPLKKLYEKNPAMQRKADDILLEAQNTIHKQAKK